MTTTFVISDTHFGHENTCTLFKREDGSPLRPFANATEMDEILVARWNNVVRPDDTVYHLGDVVINKKHLPTMNRLNGRKRLVRGNHDIVPTKVLLEYFDEIYGVKIFDKMIFSHIPLHRESVVPRMGTNVHGHLHGFDIPDGAYYNVCVENINYTPIAIDDLKQKIEAKRRYFFECDYEGKHSGNGPG